MVSRVFCFDGSCRYESWIKSHPQYSHHTVVSLSQPLAGITENTRREFLTAYVDCVGRLSVRNHGLWWWACDISSKNRSLSPLVGPLEQFFKLIYLIEKSKEDDALLITDVPDFLMSSLRQAMLTRNVPCEWLGTSPMAFLATLKEWLLRWARILRHLFYIIPRIIKARRMFGGLIDEQSRDKTPAYLIKTFISARSFGPNGLYKDLFFGSLPDFLSKSRRTIILTDITDDFSKTLSLMKQFGEKRLYPLEAFMTITDVIEASLQIAAYKIQIPQSLEFDSYDISDLVRQLIQRHGSKIQPLHLYQYRMMKRFLEKFSVEKFLLTCEFNPWEKMCLWALREKAPAVKALGYLHTALPQASANMFVSRFEQDIIPRPEMILTVGQKPLDIITRYETCAASPMKAACGLRFEYLFNQALSAREKRGHILLALEGMPQVIGLANYVLQQWPSCKSYQLRIRAHPFVPLVKFKDQLCCDPAGVPQVEMSQSSSLQEDLSWADIVIYSGSTVALEALSMGKPLVQFDDGSVLSNDPLFELNDFKWRVNKYSGLKGILDEITNLPQKAFEEQCQKARAYMTSYFHPVTSDAMRLFD